MFINSIFVIQDLNFGEEAKEFLKSYWFVIGMLFGAVLYLIEQKYKK
ncbi:hypothetical protein SAMN05428987_0209 [Paenibacillus sp. CF095]|nr:hypothetical protein [Paenibacillus sp. CF095]SDE01857.1 hypothetical protein SAMN05428987_0209 [Paenibacillus sp. CF095]